MSDKVKLDLQIEVSIACHECGSDLECQMNNFNDIEVWPCERCLATEKQIARDDGWADGHDAGYQEAIDDSQDLHEIFEDEKEPSDDKEGKE